MLITEGRRSRLTWIAVLYLAVGALTLVASFVFDVSFVRGFFQGATVALFGFALYLLVKTRRATRRGDADAEGWLPSRDGS